MSVTKKANGKWYARWRDPSGKQRARTFDRKLDADRWLATAMVDTLTGRYVDPKAGRETVGSTPQVGQGAALARLDESRAARR